MGGAISPFWRAKLRFPRSWASSTSRPTASRTAAARCPPQAAAEHARDLVREGADLLDLGAESTRPGSDPVPADEELSRLLPVLEHLGSEHAVPLSIDTSKARVAELALAGAPRSSTT